MKNIVMSAAIMMILLITSSVIAGNDKHHHHGETMAQLQLNEGKKWEADVPLRMAINKIRESISANHNAIHENRLSTKGYHSRAKIIEGEVSNIVKQCKLPSEADEQLHIIVAELLVGADQMANNVNPSKSRQGAIKVINALNSYGKYFEDASFKPLNTNDH